ncbi:MAG: hypothetical protein DMG97_40135 [Acidobacteria bacterium]|nr:MAG: hypothetical protein DMG97_40135 [Acidobacteriota bacterium]
MFNQRIESPYRTSERPELLYENKALVALDSNVPADHLAQPGRYNGLAILLFGVEHPTHADGAVLVQSGDLSLTQQLVVCFGVFGRYVEPPESQFENPVSREFKHVTKAALAAVVPMRHQASLVQDFRCLH